MTKWKPSRKALTVGVNVLSDPWAGAPVGGSKKEAPRRKTSTPWRQSHLDRSASAPASLLRLRSTHARGSTGCKSSGKLGKTTSRWSVTPRIVHAYRPKNVFPERLGSLEAWMPRFISRDTTREAANKPCKPNGQRFSLSFQLSTVLELLEGAFYGMDLLKLHSITSKLLDRVDHIEKVKQHFIITGSGT